jgi:hypothetical protein
MKDARVANLLIALTPSIRFHSLRMSARNHFDANELVTEDSISPSRHEDRTDTERVTARLYVVAKDRNKPNEYLWHAMQRC